MGRWTRGPRALAALGALSLGACHDPCFLVVDCVDSPRIAVEGRILETETGAPFRGAALTLLVQTPTGLDSSRAVSDARGMFSFVAPLPAPPADTSVALALRVRPRGKPSFVVSPLDCRPTTRWADACVLNPLAAEPTIALFKFVHRYDVARGVRNARVTFVRTGGARLVGRQAVDAVQATTDSTGVARLFGSGIFPDSGAVVGELRVELPTPIGTTTRQNFRIRIDPRFNAAQFIVQPVGPNLEYLMVFADSITGRRLAGVEMRFFRRSGIPTNADTARFLSNDDGLAFLTMQPLAQGTVTGDFAITPPGSSQTTTLAGVALNTFDADSSIVLARWSVGATGRLYPVPPP